LLCLQPRRGSAEAWSSRSSSSPSCGYHASPESWSSSAERRTFEAPSKLSCWSVSISPSPVSDVC
jgi:hypothetical protein